MPDRKSVNIAVTSFALGSITMYIALYSWHQRTLKFIGVAYKLAYDEIQEAKGETGES